MLKQIKTKDGIMFHTVHFFGGQRSPQRSTGTSVRREAERIDRERQVAFEAEVTERLSGKPALPPLTIDLMAQWKRQESVDKELHTQYATADSDRYFTYLSQHPWNFNRVTVEDRWAYVRMRRAQLTKSGNPPFYRSLKRELYFLGWGLKKAKKKGYPIELDLEMPDFPDERKHEKTRGHMIPVDYFKAWRAHLPPAEADQVLVQVLTGLRHGELRQLDLSFVRTHCEAPTPGVVAYIDLPVHVCERERTVALTQAAYAALQRILPVAAGQKSKIFKRAAEAAGLPRAPHERDLRTTFANMAAIHGGDEKGVDLAMGHLGKGSGRHYQQAYDQRLAKIALCLAASFHPVSPDYSTCQTCPTCNGSGIVTQSGNLAGSETRLKTV